MHAAEALRIAANVFMAFEGSLVDMSLFRIATVGSIRSGEGGNGYEGVGGALNDMRTT